MTKYRHLFFDLDHTLWDYERNASETLSELFDQHFLADELNTRKEDFIAKYHMVNDELWNKHDIGLIDKSQIRKERFSAIFNHFGSNDQTKAKALSREFLEECPKKGHIFPFVIDALQYLKDKYTLHVITNGFKDMQAVKMRTSGIDHFFQQIIISEEVGYKKPQTEIFNFALAKAGAGNYEAVMIGDNLIVDIAGARNARIDQVFFNPKRKPFNDQVTYHINCHSELKGIF